MPRIRYTGPIEELSVAPAGHPAFSATRLEWVDVPTEVAGKRPCGTPGDESYDPGEGLLAQGDWADGKFTGAWELESTKKAAATRAASEKES